MRNDHDLKQVLAVCRRVGKMRRSSEVITVIQMRDDGGLNQAPNCEEVAKSWLYFEIRNIRILFKKKQT